jgi:hypothetical protein
MDTTGPLVFPAKGARATLPLRVASALAKLFSRLNVPPADDGDDIGADSADDREPHTMAAE